MIVLIMGVSGSGKSTVGREVARRLGWRLIEADDFQPPSNVEKMRHAEPLTDADREPWLSALAAEIASCEARGEDAVVPCSALKRRYRETLLAGARASLVVHLCGSFDLLLARMHAREHFMPPELLETQFHDLERPEGEGVLVLDVTRSPGGLAEEVVRRVESARRGGSAAS